MKKQVKDSLYISIISYSGAILGYANKILLFPLILLPEQVGLANIMISIAAVYAQFSSLGVTNIILKFFPFFGNNKLKHNGILSWAFIVSAIGFVVFTIAFIFFEPQVQSLYSKSSGLLVEYYFYLIPLGFVTLIYSIFEAYLRSLHKTVFPSFLTDVVIRVLISVIIVLLYFNIINFREFITAYVVVYSVPSALLIIYIFKIKEFFVFAKISEKIKHKTSEMMNYYQLRSF